MKKEPLNDVRICLLGASFETNNLGIKALTYGAIRAILSHYPNAEIIILDYGINDKNFDIALSDRSIKIQVKTMRFSKRIYLKKHILSLIFISLLQEILPKNIRKKILLKNEILSTINSSSFVASIAAGDSFSDLYGLLNFFYVTLPQLIAIILGKKLILLPQTIGPFQTKIAKYCAKHVLSNAHFIFVRSHDGLRIVRELMKDEFNEDRVRFSYDLGFILDTRKPSEELMRKISAFKSSLSTCVGLNISGMLYQGGYSIDKKDMFGFKTNYRELIEHLIEFLIVEKGANVILIPHVFGHFQSDLSACETVYNQLKEQYPGKLLLIQETENEREIKYVIGLCDFFIGSRMHACIAALSQSVPSVAIVYSNKFKGVMESIDLSDVVADPRAMDEAEIMTIINANFEKRRETIDDLNITMPKVKNSILKLFAAFQ